LIRNDISTRKTDTSHFILPKKWLTRLLYFVSKYQQIILVLQIGNNYNSTILSIGNFEIAIDFGNVKLSSTSSIKVRVSFQRAEF